MATLLPLLPLLLAVTCGEPRLLPPDSEADTDSDCAGDADSDCDGDADSDTGPEPRVVGVSGDGFVLDGAPFAFVGANLRGVSHYGGGDLLPWATAEDRATNLDAVRDFSGRGVRLFAANEQVDDATSAERLAVLLDACAERDIYAIVALTDFYDTGFSPRGDEGWYQMDANGYTVLSDGFFRGGWRDRYEPFVRTVVARNAAHPAVLAWELGNEVKNVPDPGIFVDFALDVAALVRGLDSDTLVTGGIISTVSAALSDAQARRLYGVGGMDFLTARAYDTSSVEDLALAASLGLPLVVEEVGFSSGDRPAATRDACESLAGAGVDGVLQWGLMATDHDNGDGDRVYGMDRVFHDDWDRLAAAWAAAAGRSEVDGEAQGQAGSGRL